MPENTAYNCMIYITFFIVILIDKRGGKRDDKRDAKRDDKRDDTKNEYTYEHIRAHTIHQRQKRQAQHRAATAQRKRGTAPPA